MSNYIAVPQAQGESLGAITYWSLENGHTIPRSDLMDALASVGLDESYGPPKPSEQNLLVRACRHAGGNRHVVRTKGALVHVLAEDKSDVDNMVLASAAIFMLAEDGVGGTAVKVLRDDINFGSKIVSSYVDMRDVFTPEDVSHWLTNSAERHHAVRLRAAGGVYFIPQPRQEEWRLLAEGLAVVSRHRVATIPALKVGGASDAVLEALASECKALLNSMEEFALAHDPEKPRDRAVKTKMKELDAMNEKIALYAGTVDKNLDDLQAQFARVRGVLADQKVVVAAAEVIGTIGGAP